MSPQRIQRHRGPAYDWRDHPESGQCPACDWCAHRARWAIARLEDTDTDWQIKAFACGQHLHSSLDALDWVLDVVQVYDLAMIPEGGC